METCAPEDFGDEGALGPQDVSGQPQSLQHEGRLAVGL